MNLCLFSCSILNEFVQKTPVMAEKRNQKEVQELAQKLLEAVSNIAGASLEQTTWLRKNYAVKPGLQQSEDPETEEGNQAEEGRLMKDVFQKKTAKKVEL